MRKPFFRAILLVAVTLAAVGAGGFGVGHGAQLWQPWFYEMPEFIGWCRSSDPRDIRACETYVCGVVDALAAERLINKAATHPFCLPAGIVCGDLRRIVVGKLEQRPYYLHTIIADAIRYELEQSFPCPGGG